ncbi:MAG: hypothetical protein HFACDABA_02252 [Anaerolineales bacterium]|nr:hypothetical protein [Anaerolineales bacterium]
MISIIYVFWMYVFLFGVIGMLRGWAKELLVAFAVVVALTLNFLLRKFAPVVSTLDGDDATLFWIREIILLTLVYFGYQTVISVARLQAGARRERLQDSLFGLVLGGVNGYLVAGSSWFYLDAANYPFPNIFITPTGELAAKIDAMMNLMPPFALGEPAIYFASVIVLVFILVVYV